jgi:hypothetical protein
MSNRPWLRNDAGEVELSPVKNCFAVGCMVKKRLGFYCLAVTLSVT